jgi:erythronate-4-phosphate dehydrogenase
MKIVADANIVDVSALYEAHGDLALLSGREIGPADVRDADALLVRSITRVDARLLEGSKVRFVATATSGTDHLDLAYLSTAGIAVADAAGSNANAVVEYVLASLARLILAKELDLDGKHVAIIGFGHVGRRLYESLNELSIRCVLCDPFVAARQDGLPFCSLDEALRAPIISLHTPFTKAGPHPTFHMLDAQRLSALAPGTVLINAARGEVLDNAALTKRLQQDKGLLTVLDCWENEPSISAELLRLARLGTPHIAGYSIEAKRSASERNYQAFLRHFELRDTRSDEVDAPSRTLLTLPKLNETAPRRLLAHVLNEACDVLSIDTQLRAGRGEPDAALFDAIRKKISQRREFSHYALDLAAWHEGQKKPAFLAQLRALGFGVQD